MALCQPGRLSITPYASLALYRFIGDEACVCWMRQGITAGVSVRWRMNHYLSLSGAPSMCLECPTSSPLRAICDRTT